MHTQKHQTLQLKLMHSTKLLLTVWLISFQTVLYIRVIHKQVRKQYTIQCV